MAWREGLLLGGVGVLTTLVNVAFKDSVETVAEAEVKTQLHPIEKKMDEVHQSQLRMEDWFRQHLEDH